MARTKQDRFVRIKCSVCKKDHSSGTICTIQPSIKYRSCKKSELSFFAASRGLVIRDACPRRQDYIEALEQADQSPPRFRFLDLPPEMRNWVYSNLLILNNSTTCHPQILQTCKQINSEASTILYADNPISIRISQDSVHVHNIRCGPYTPDILNIRRRGCVRHRHDFTSLSWPDFLYKAKHISITAQQKSTFDRSTRKYIRRVPADNTLYSLCTALRSHGSVCRRVDFYYLPIFDEKVLDKLLPFQILGLRSMQIAPKDGGGILPLLPSKDSDLGGGIMVKLGILHKALILISKLRNQNSRPSRSMILQEWLEVGWSSLGSGGSRENQRDYWAGEDSLWMRAFHQAAVKLRILLETKNVKRFDLGLFYEVQRMLRLEMGMLALRGHGREIEGRVIALEEG